MSGRFSGSRRLSGRFRDSGRLSGRFSGSVGRHGSWKRTCRRRRRHSGEYWGDSAVEVVEIIIASIDSNILIALGYLYITIHTHHWASGSEPI